MESISAEEAYRLRALQIEAQRCALKTEQARIEMMQALLEIEQKYGLLIGDNEINMKTGEITRK